MEEDPKDITEEEQEGESDSGTELYWVRMYWTVRTCDMNLLYVLILGEPDHQYLLYVGSTDDEEDGISIGDFEHDPDVEEKTEMEQDYACMRIEKIMFCEDMMDFDDDDPMELS